MKIALKKALVFAAAALVVVVSQTNACQTASAQSASSQCESGHCRFRVSGPNYGSHVVAPFHFGYRSPSYGYGYRPVGYDYRYGTAELLRAAAQANLVNSHARTQHAHAARLEMGNSVDFLATRLERKRINKESRFGHLRARGEQVQREQLVHAVAQPAPRRVVDPVSGEVDWPLLLRSSYFAKARRPIDLVFHQRSKNGRLNPDHFLPMRDWIEQIECELKANVAYYELEDYLAAKSFLRELVNEARVDLDVVSFDNRLAAQ